MLSIGTGDVTRNLYSKSGLCSLETAHHLLMLLGHPLLLLLDIMMEGRLLLREGVGDISMSEAWRSPKHLGLSLLTCGVSEMWLVPGHRLIVVHVLLRGYLRRDNWWDLCSWSLIVHIKTHVGSLMMVIYRCMDQGLVMSLLHGETVGLFAETTQDAAPYAT